MGLSGLFKNFVLAIQVINFRYYKTKLFHTVQYISSQFSLFPSDPPQLLVTMAQQHVAQQHVAQPEQQQPLTLQEGLIQSCQGYMERKTKYLKRWKRRWFAVEPGIWRFDMYYL